MRTAFWLLVAFFACDYSWAQTLLSAPIAATRLDSNKWFAISRNTRDPAQTNGSLFFSDRGTPVPTADLLGADSSGRFRFTGREADRLAIQIITNTPATNVNSIFNQVVIGSLPSSLACAWGDFNNDGFADLLVTPESLVCSRLYQNNRDGTFSEFQFQIDNCQATNIVWSGGNAWADFDNDGLLDFVIGGRVNGTNYLFRNRGDGQFSKSAISNLTRDPANARSCAWGDYDNDGNVDLFLAYESNSKNVLLRNNGNGTFNEVLSGSIVNDIATWRACAWADYNNDGWLDLFVANSNGNNGLYRNNKDGSFTKITDGSIVNDGGHNAWGCAWGDYDNDGNLDLFVANRGENNFLYRNNGGGTFTRITTGEIVNEIGGWVSCAWADYDNDGFLDLFVTNVNGKNALYRNGGDGTFSKVTSESLGSEEGRSHGCAWADYDNNGFLDLFVTNYSLNDDRLYRNVGNKNAWLRIKGVGVHSNRSAIGAKVKVNAFYGSQDRWQLREISGGSGFDSQNSLDAHFGLGDATKIKTLRIEWPSGIVQEMHNLSMDQILTVTEPPILRTGLRPGDGGFEVILVSRGGLNYAIQISSDLENWSMLTTLKNVNGPTAFIDSLAKSQQFRFYRAVTP